MKSTPNFRTEEIGTSPFHYYAIPYAEFAGQRWTALCDETRGKR
jgi:hypothetical protein